MQLIKPQKVDFGWENVRKGFCRHVNHALLPNNCTTMDLPVEFLRLWSYWCKVQIFRDGHKDLSNLPHGFNIYLVNVKTIRKIAQIFVAFSEKLNFPTFKIWQNKIAWIQAFLSLIEGNDGTCKKQIIKYVTTVSRLIWSAFESKMCLLMNSKCFRVRYSELNCIWQMSKR